MSNWIPVEDRLPEYGRRVLIIRRANWGKESAAIVRAARRMSTDASGQHWDMDRGEYENQYREPFGHISHWMPLPEPPEVPHE